ncbi:MAG: YabP/YqfC family sporulation protein [Candidatus Ventricola sp.]
MRGTHRSRRMILKSALPEDALTRGARVTLIAQSSALVEGQRGVVELSDGRIRLRTAGGVLTVAGQGLRLHELSLDAAMIVGEPIVTVTYGRPEA